MIGKELAHEDELKVEEARRRSFACVNERCAWRFGLRTLLIATVYSAVAARAASEHGAAGLVAVTIAGYVGFALVQTVRSSGTAVLLLGAFASGTVGAGHFAGEWWTTYCSLHVGVAINDMTSSYQMFIVATAAMMAASFCGCVATLIILRWFVRRKTPIREMSATAAMIFAFSPAGFSIAAIHAFDDPLFWSTHGLSDGEKWLVYHGISFMVQVATASAVVLLLRTTANARFSASAALWTICNQWLILAILYPMSDYL